MRTKLLVFLLALAACPLFAQQPEQTLFRRDRLRGGFGGPIFTCGLSSERNSYGAGGGGGLVFDRVFVGLFGMGDVFDVPKIGRDQFALGYGGLWLGYVFPSHKVIHLYTSAKVGGGTVGYTDFDDHWDFEDHWNDAVLVMTPEAGLELNITRWFRLSGSVGYRWVNGFEGNTLVSKNDLNAPYTALTLRFGWFSKGHKAPESR
ncbi:MAG TPA: hypothetical protein PK971_03975 [Saprospiraceae bacterium]|nr:hypothetical protein [Saprospiraceae bacterium]HND87459.1 hypothetical protein [Saprospiraceae bacterium]